MCLTETQKKVDDIKIVKDVKIIQTMREMQDRKGGGLVDIVEQNPMIKHCTNKTQRLNTHWSNSTQWKHNNLNT